MGPTSSLWAKQLRLRPEPKPTAASKFAARNRLLVVIFKTPLFKICRKGNAPPSLAVPIPPDNGGAIGQPDFSDPLYLKYWVEFAAAAGCRYDGNPYPGHGGHLLAGLLGRGSRPADDLSLGDMSTCDILRTRVSSDNWRGPATRRVTFCFVSKVVPSNAPRVITSLRRPANPLFDGAILSGRPHKLARVGNERCRD